jgi:excisionase family DNA binding protein
MASLRERAVGAEEGETAGLQKLEAILSAEQGPEVQLVTSSGERVALPPSVRKLLTQAVHELAAGKAVTVLPLDAELSTQEAADMLNVSRPYLIKMLEAGEIPFRLVGLHRRMTLDDVLHYKAERSKRTRALLDQLTRESQEMGLYD